MGVGAFENQVGGLFEKKARLREEPGFLSFPRSSPDWKPSRGSNDVGVEVVTQGAKREPQRGFRISFEVTWSAPHLGVGTGHGC